VRETFREATSTLTRGQLAAVRAYQRSDEGEPATAPTAFHDARRRVPALLTEAVL
jgi:hypothetical protein